MKKIALDIKKSMEAVTEAVQKTSELGKAVAIGVQSGAKEFSDQSKKEAYERMMKKYNPLFQEQYSSSNFNIPNMIMIVDDAVRKGIEVCEGAIGWLRTENEVEVLCLYDEAVKFSGLQFVPSATCDSIYYVDSFDRTRFVRVDCLFSKAYDDKIAELQHIAYSLGAKSCFVEIEESDLRQQENRKRAGSKEHFALKGLKIGAEASAESEESSQSSTYRRGRAEIVFAGSQEVKLPELKWFLHDENIKRLVEMRMQGGNELKALDLKLEGSASATMSQKTGLLIDGAISKLGMKSSANMEKQASRENHSKLIFHIEF